MHLLFPADSLEPRQPERDYAHEIKAAHAAGFTTHIFNFDALARGAALNAICRLPPAEVETPLLYRGWMIRSEHYEPLYQALLTKNYRLITNPTAYARTHDFSQHTETLGQYGAANAVFHGVPEEFDDNKLEELAEHARHWWGGIDVPLVVKDFVKSQKYAWREACFIRSNQDKDAFLRVTRRFLELQGDLLQGGLVFRAYMPLRELGRHHHADMPLHAEFRAFIWHGQRFWSSPRHIHSNYAGLEPDWSLFEGLINLIDSPFWTLDVAATEPDKHAKYGAWVALEIGDGQVSGLPDESQADEFYQALADVKG